MVAVVTGADRGLGRSLAEALAQRGWTVYAGCLGEAPEFSSGVAPLALDVRSDASVAAAARRVEAEAASVDLVINNAGILGDFTFTVHDPLDFEDMKATYDVNALGPLRVAWAFYPLVRRGGFKLIASISSEAGSLHQTRVQKREARFGYCMSKSALNAGMLILRNTAAKQGVRVVLVEPGWLRTYMHGEKNLRAALEPDEAAAEILDTLLAPLPPEVEFIDRHGAPYAF